MTWRLTDEGRRVGHGCLEESARTPPCMTTTRGTTTNDRAVSIAATLTPMLLTPEQAAHVLGIGRTSVYALLRKGELGSVRLGRSRRIPYRCLVDFVDHVVAPDSSR